MAVKFKKSQFLTKNDYTVRLTDSISYYWKDAIYSYVRPFFVCVLKFD